MDTRRTYGMNFTDNIPSEWNDFQDETLKFDTWNLHIDEEEGAGWEFSNETPEADNDDA